MSMRKPNGHHSRISTLMIDCPADSFEDSLAFWSEALGLKSRKPAAKQRYVTLGEIPGPLFVRLQKVDSAKHAGFHLDIESDSVAKEAARLEAAGARRKYHIKRWWVLEDPAGNPFCVIRPESEDFPEHARHW